MDYFLYKQKALKETKFTHSLIPKSVYEVFKAACRYYGDDRVQLDVGYDGYPESAYRELVDRLSFSANVMEEDLETMFYPSGFWSIYSVLIHFPEVTVSNELDQSTTIYDLFARVPLTRDGRIATQFRLVKATYMSKEIATGYMHSHCHPIDANHPEYWDTPCLGTGPIKSTQLSLMTQYDLTKYVLFFWELDKFTQVESLSGVPYLKLSNLGISRITARPINDCQLNIYMNDTEVSILTTFIKSYLATNLFTFRITNNKAILGKPFVEWIVELSEYYQKWRILADSAGYQNLDSWKRLYMIKDNMLYSSIGTATLSTNVGTLIVKFKGKDFTLKITENNTETFQIELLDVSLCYFILSRMLSYINACYYDKQSKYTPDKFQDGVLKNRIIGVTL